MELSNDQIKAFVETRGRDAYLSKRAVILAKASLDPLSATYSLTSGILDLEKDIFKVNDSKSALLFDEEGSQEKILNLPNI